MVHEACEALGVPILTSERFEADDVIGTLASKAAAAGLRRRHRHERQGLLPARARRRPRLQPARRRHVVRRGRREGEVRRRARAGRRRAGADGRHDRQHQGRARHRREGRARADRQVRIARRPARARRPSSRRSGTRGAARQRRRRAPEPRAGAHPHRRAGRRSIPRRSATAAPSRERCFELFTSSASARSSPSSRRPPTPSPRDYRDRRHRSTSVRALAARLQAAGRVRVPRAAPIGRRPMRAVDRRPRVFDRGRATRDYVPDRPSRRSATRRRCRSTTALGAAEAAARGSRRSRRSATT